MDGQDPDGRVGDPLLHILVRRYLDHLRPEQRVNWGGAKQATFKAIAAISPEITVSKFDRSVQKDLIAYLHAGGRAVRSIAACMRLISAAITWGNQPDDQKNVISVHRPDVIASDGKIAELLNAPVPPPRNYHPGINEMAVFIAAIQDDEELYRQVFLQLASACRPSCATEATSRQLDCAHALFYLNPPDRRQQPKKHRATLPLSPAVLEELKSWGDGKYISSEYESVRRRFYRVRDSLGMSKEFVPYSIRHFMATAIRHAHLWYSDKDVHPVPKEERDLYLGHRHLTTGDLYGVFDPEYLSLAKRAVEAILRDLDEKSGGALFRQVSAKESTECKPPKEK